MASLRRGVAPSMSTVLESALRYISRGWSVFPVGGNKRPLAAWESYQRRIATEDEVKAWYDQWTNAGLAIVTGKISGLVVLDIDPGHGGEASLKKLLKDRVLTASDLETSSVTTQSGGTHYYFRYPSDTERVPNARGLWPGIDVRADGGYVVAPPTLGETGKLYTWNGAGDAPEGLQYLPDALADALAKRGTKQTLSDEVKSELLSPQSEGGRHDAMLKLVGHFAAIGETRAASWRIISLWNDKNTPPIVPEELHRQFEDMWSRFVVVEAEATLEEAVEAVRNAVAEGGDSKILLQTVLEGRKLSRIDHAKWRERLSDEFKFGKGYFDNLVIRLGHAESKDDVPDEYAPVEVTGERAEVAKELLQRPSFLYEVLQTVARIGLVQEEANALLTYLAGSSRCLDDPINLMVMGESATGKSQVILTVLELFPNEEKLVLVGMTPKAIIYDPRPLRHKIIVLLELAGGEAANLHIRTFQSEKLIKYNTVEKDPITGKNTTVMYVKEGPAAWMSTTTRLSHDIQNESRNWPIFPDASVTQSWKVAESQTRPPGRLSDDEMLPYWDAQRMLAAEGLGIAYPTEIHQVILSFIKERNPNIRAVFRRDNLRIREMMRASAFVYQWQRPLVNGEVIPDIRDYYMLYRIAHKSFEQSIDPVLYRAEIRDTVLVVHELFAATGEGVKPKDIRAALLAKGYTSPLNTMRDWMEKAKTAGALEHELWHGFFPVGMPPVVAKPPPPGQDEAILEEPQLLPDPTDVLERVVDEHPELAHWEHFEFVDPIDGEPVRTSPPEKPRKRR